jgi:hypothetical protein
MIRMIYFRQRKNLSENLRQTLRSIRWGSHHVADVAEVNFCLPSGIVFDGTKAIARIRNSAASFGS